MKQEDKKCDVLIVDDDRDLCLILRLGLQADCSVHCEHSLAEAAAWLAKHQPSLVLLDNSLPDGSGVEFIQKMMDAVPDIKVVMMTADPSAAVRPLALLRGASGFLAKPFKVSAMRDIVFSIFPGLSAA